MMLYAAFPSNADYRYHYAYWDGNNWFNKEITPAGSWFSQTAARAIEKEPNYSGGLIFDQNEPSVIYLSKQVNGAFEIFKYTMPDYGVT
ncbi:MAG: hypothetical protein LBF25_00485 [Puniceicoccales bacterium]|jgi:hypothetical protein|nr:hypothetical protein [Puniceicoccales bacterium]